MGCWSPDGKTIAFISWQKNLAAEVYLIPAHGGKAKQLTNFSAYGWLRPIWSLDGKAIYTTYRDGEGAKIVAINVKDGSFRPIFNFDTPGKLDFTL